MAQNPTNSVKDLLANYKQTETLKAFIKFLDGDDQEGESKVGHFLLELRKNTELKEFQQYLTDTLQHINPHYSILNEYLVFHVGFVEHEKWIFKRRMRALFHKHGSMAGLAELQKTVKANPGETYKGYFASHTYKSKHPKYKSSVGVAIKDSIGIIVFQEGYYIGTCNDVQAEYFALLYLLVLAIALGIRRIKIAGCEKDVIHGMLGYIVQDNKKVKSQNNNFVALIKDECKLLVRNFEAATFLLIPMFLNEEARDLASVKKESYF
jgi:hypothetical protein